MDRWRSGTPETCHSSHHHAACTRSASLPLQVLFPLLFFSMQHFPLSSLHLSSCFQTRHSLRDFDIISLFQPSTDDPPSRRPSSLWHLFLGFVISSGNILPFYPVFYPFFLALPLIFSPFCPFLPSKSQKQKSYFSTIDIQKVRMDR